MWFGLMAGIYKVEGWSHEPGTWSLTVGRHAAGGQPSPLTLRPRDRAIVERTLLCGVRKIVAAEVGLSCSSIAVIMQSCFQFMGLPCLPSRMPGLVVAAAHAHARSGHRSLVTPQSTALASWSVRMPRPDLALAAWLAPAEHAVIGMLVEGQTYAEIALARETSVRTVANQVASGFRRLGVSGRAELLCLLARWGLDGPAPPSERPPASTSVVVRRPSPSRERRLEPTLQMSPGPVS